jgi:hypothetical protein
MIILYGLELYVYCPNFQSLLVLTDLFLHQAFYSAQAALGYSIGNVAHGLANNGMSDAERAALLPSDPEYDLRCVKPFRYKIRRGLNWLCSKQGDWFQDTSRRLDDVFALDWLFKAVSACILYSIDGMSFPESHL